MVQRTVFKFLIVLDMFSGCSSINCRTALWEGRTIFVNGNNQRHGKYNLWYPNGMKKLEVEYKNDRKEGIEVLGILLV